ncbi:MAG: ATP-binding cassette domain-containing protein [Flavobacteriaceae bacterium]
MAIVGATGAGKSTIINLLNRFYEINAGSIYIDGRNIKEYTLEVGITNCRGVARCVFVCRYDSEQHHAAQSGY